MVRRRHRQWVRRGGEPKVVVVFAALLVGGSWLFAATLAVGAETGPGGQGAQELFASVQEGTAVGLHRLTEDAETARSRLVAIDVAWLDAVRDSLASLPSAVTSPAAEAPPGLTRNAVLRLNLFDDVVVTGLVERTAQTFSGGYSLSGPLLDQPLGTMTLVVNDKIVAGTVRTGGDVYHIRSVDEGAYAVLQVEQEPMECDVGRLSLWPTVEAKRSAGSPPGAALVSSGGVSTLEAAGAAKETPPDSVVDVAVFYVPRTRAHFGGTAEVETHIDTMVAETNLAYRQSGVHQSINLVAVEELDDGWPDQIAVIREESWADIVVRVDHRGGGAAPRMTELSTRHGERAFAYSSHHTYIFAHELGHIMGLGHDRHVACGSGGVGRGNCSYRVTPDAHGYVNQRAFDPDAPIAKRWRTIMAYSNQLAAHFGGCSSSTCPRVLRFSNPRHTYPEVNGDPMGVALTASNGDSLAVDGPADAVRTLNITRTFVADFRAGRPVEATIDPERTTLAEGETTTVTVRLDKAPLRDLVIPLTVSSPDGAWSGDYAVPSSVEFAPDTTEQTFTFSALVDLVDEDDETVALSFGTLPGGVTAGSDAPVAITLTDDDVLPVPYLSALEVSPGRLAPDFEPTTAAYAAVVPDSATSVMVTPTAVSANDTVTVDGTVVASGEGVPITANDGPLVTVRVTAPGGKTKDYTITVDRQPLWTLQLVRGDPRQPFTTVPETNEDLSYRGNFLILKRGSSLTPLPEHLNVTVGGTASNPADYEFNNPFRTVSRKSDDRAQGARRITVKGDTDSEENETITFSVEIDQTWTATLTIVDDDLAVANTAATGAPTIDNQAPMLGQMLTATVGDMADADGLPNGAHFNWQWMRAEGSGETDISGAAASTYTVTDADLGMPLKVRASFKDLAGNDESRTSAATAAVRVGTVSMSIDDAVIGGDGVVNIAEKAAGFPVMGTVDADSTVSVTVGNGAARDAAVTGTAWSLSVPPNAPEVAGANVSVAATATKTNYEAGQASGSFTVDLDAPSADWEVPVLLAVGEAITDIAPDGPSADIQSYAVQGGTLPQGLALDTADGTIRGTPGAASATTSAVTIRVTDKAGNTADEALTFPAVAKGTQVLTGFAYSSDAATLRQPPPMVTAPTGLIEGSTLSYASGDEAVCTVDSGTGALTLVDIGTCTITATAAATDDYHEATATYTVQVSAPPDDTALTALTLTDVDIGTFSTDVFAYVGTAPYAVSATTVTAWARDARATVAIVGFDESVAGLVRTVPLGVGSNELSVLVTAADGETQATYSASVTRSAPGGFALAAGNVLPTGLWSDGDTLWIADWSDDDVWAYALATGERRPDRDVNLVGYCAPAGLWSNGELMWVLDHCLRTVRAYRLSDGARQSARDLTDLGPQSPSGLWSDGETAWIMGTADVRLYAHGLSDGTRQAERDIVLARDRVTWQQGLWMDEETVWVGDRISGNSVRAYRRADGLPQPSRDLTWVAPQHPAGLWSDGEYVWLTTWRGTHVRVGPVAPGVGSGGRLDRVGRWFPVGRRNGGTDRHGFAAARR